jgi:hypothetical protein
MIKHGDGIQKLKMLIYEVEFPFFALDSISFLQLSINVLSCALKEWHPKTVHRLDDLFTD